MSIIPSDFEWSTDDDVIVREQAAIAVYRNAAGGVVIRQERAWEEDSDVFIVVRPEYAAVVASAIMRALGDDAPLALPAPSPANSDAAERQRRYRKRKRHGGRDVTGVTRDVTRDGVTVTQRDSVTGGA